MKNGNKKILLIVGIAIIVIGIIIIAIFMLKDDKKNMGSSGGSGNADMVCTLDANIGETISVKNEASFIVDANKVTSSKVTSTITTTDINDETFTELKNYNSQLLENNQSISNMYHITTTENSFSVEENITYNKKSNDLSLDISQMRANLLIPDYDSNNALDNVKKEYQDYGYSCK